jgi:dual-specificity kinase
MSEPYTVRAGLSAYTNARANTSMPTSQKGATSASASYAAAASSSSTHAANSATTAAAAAVPTRPPRLSGGKRDVTSAAATDNLNEVQGSPINAPDTMPPPIKKKKITYALPNQNMEEGHFYVILGEDVDVSTERFKMLSLLGEGTFGKVVECWDRKLKKYCAVKIVRNIPKYTRDAKVEIEFMERLRAADTRDLFPLMKIQRHFQNDQGHVCIVMNKYGPCLLDHLQKHGPFPHRFLAEIIFQCGAALDFFHSEMRLIHTDLKPENILLETSTTVADAITGRHVPTLPCKIRICDLGGCCDERHSRTAIVSTRHYRAPEVVLGLGWMFSADMWSMGCIIYELFTGRLLYDTHDNLEHLHLFERTLNKRLPADWASRASDDTRTLFSTTTGGPRPLVDPKHIARVARSRPIQDAIADDLLRDLIMQLLHYDRTRRMTARQMTAHPYVLKYYPDSAHQLQHPNNRGPLPPPPTA